MMSAHMTNNTWTKYQGYWKNIIDIISLVLIIIIWVTNFSNYDNELEKKNNYIKNPTKQYSMWWK